jgi:hypothetical protein
MARKSLITSILSYCVYFIPAFFVWYFKENYKIGISGIGVSVFEFFFYSFPVLIFTFVGLLIFNSWLVKRVHKLTASRNNLLYFLITLSFGILLVLGFTVFDYFQFRRFGSSGKFLNILLEYSELFIFILITILINRKICFRDFKVKNLKNG